MSLENWAINKWLERLESDREEIERLLAIADGHLADYEKSRRE
jgi:predicted transcriptional regulator